METIIVSETFGLFIKENRHQNPVCKILHRYCRSSESIHLKVCPSSRFYLKKSLDINYITFRSDGNLSFLPKNKPHLTNDDGTWKREGRQESRPAKAIRKLFTDFALSKFKDSDFENFSSLYKAEFSPDGGEFFVRDNHEIPGVYDMRLMDGDGSLNNSCMNGDSNYLEIYKNCKSLEIVTLEKGAVLMGRALLWTLDHAGSKIKLMDRIYVSKEYMCEKFIDFAKKNGYWRKKHYKTYDYKTIFVCPNGTEADLDFQVETDTEFDEYPYIDTFQFGIDGMLFNSSNLEYYYTYSNTDGTRNEGDDDDDDDDDERVWDEHDREWIDEDVAIYVTRGTYTDSYIHQSDAVCVDGEFWWNGDDEIHIIDGDYYHESDVAYCEYSGGYILLDDCVTCESSGSRLHIARAVFVDGYYYYPGEEPEEETEEEEVASLNN